VTPDTLEKLHLLTLGWLLGLLGPVVTDAIRKRRENSQVRFAVFAELREVSYKLALANYLINTHFGTIDKPFLDWLKRVTENYVGPALVPSKREGIEMQLSLPPDQLAALTRRMSAPKGQNIVIPKVHVPLLDARLSTLLYLDYQVQVRLLDIRTHIILANELVDQSRYYAGLTFGKLEGDNYQLVIGNLEGCLKQYAERSQIIVSKISELDTVV
jgi:hypothetical protein